MDTNNYQEVLVVLVVILLLITIAVASIATIHGKLCEAHDELKSENKKLIEEQTALERKLKVVLSDSRECPMPMDIIKDIVSDINYQNQVLQTGYHSDSALTVLRARSDMLSALGIILTKSGFGSRRVKVEGLCIHEFNSNFVLPTDLTKKKAKEIGKLVELNRRDPIKSYVECRETLNKVSRMVITPPSFGY